MRVPVAQIAPALPGWSGAGPLEVGLVRWTGVSPLRRAPAPPSALVTVLVKAALPCAPPGEGARLDLSDFVSWKALRDIVLSERARAAGLAPVVPEVIGPDSVIELLDPSARAERLRITLPGLWPEVHVIHRGARPRRMEMRCDTVWIDSELERVVLLWRGVTEDRPRARVERLIASLERAADPRSIDALEVARADFSYAIEERDLRGAADPDEDDGDAGLALAELDAWERPAEPALPLERYTQISAELAARREDRKSCLARHDLTEDRWGIEDRAWSEKILQTSDAGDVSLAVRAGALFAAARAKLPPGGGERS